MAVVTVISILEKQYEIWTMQVVIKFQFKQVLDMLLIFNFP